MAHQEYIDELFGSGNEDSDSSDDPPPALVEDEEIYPVRTYGTQTVIGLQVKQSSFNIHVGQCEWAFVELELIPAHLEWGPVLEQLNIDWVVSAAQELSISRQFMHGESMDADMSRGPYIQQFNEQCVYCCTPSPWGSIGIYVNNTFGRYGMFVDELFQPSGRVFFLHPWHHWDTRWGGYVETDYSVVEEAMNFQYPYVYRNE